VPIAAVLLVLTSSFFHVAWNSLVKTSGDPLATATRAVTLGIVVVTPAALVAWLATGRPSLAPEGWAIALVSGIVSAAYFVPLSAAYRRGALSSVYPVARGSGALLGVIVGVTILGEQLAPAGLVGVALLLGGTLAAASTTASRATIAPALLAGCAVATYSALDRVGVRTGPAWLYAWVLWSICAMGLIAWGVIVGWARARRTGPGPGRVASAGSAAAAGGRAFATTMRADRAETLRSLAAGLLIIGTYMLILLAFEIAPLAGVAPLREATTILAAAWGVVVLKERDHAGTRLAAAGAVGVGAILLATSG
jgi:drug/metabolite transporter (DMT)-like permease